MRAEHAECPGHQVFSPTAPLLYAHGRVLSEYCWSLWLWLWRDSPISEVCRRPPNENAQGGQIHLSDDDACFCAFGLQVKALRGQTGSLSMFSSWSSFFSSRSDILATFAFACIAEEKALLKCCEDGSSDSQSDTSRRLRGRKDL